jgi:hypothetical protein
MTEAYRDYRPPFDATKLVSKLLASVPTKYLKGLDCVVLTNELGLPRKDRTGKIWSRKRKIARSRVLGLYHRQSRDSLPYIELRVDRIAADLRRATFLGATPLREIAFGQVLFHELGHHIHSSVRPEHREKEDVADDWAGKLSVNFIRRNYWYLLPILIPASKVYTFMRRKRWI